MKRLRFLTLFTILLSVVVFAGCEDDDDRRKEEMNRKIDRLESEIESLKEKESGVKEETPASGNAQADTIDSIAEAVDEVTKKTDGAVPSGNAEEKRTQFFQLKRELDIVDDRLDAFEDYIEDMYKSGDITYDDYINKDKTLEELEDKLDASEDKLELNFGIDD